MLLGDFTNKIEAVKRRYNGSRIVVYGDMNVNGNAFKKDIENLLGKKTKYHYETDINKFTRFRVIKDKKV